MMESDVASLHPFQRQREAILPAQFDLDEREVARLLDVVRSRPAPY